MHVSVCEGKSIATGSGGKARGPPDQGLGEDLCWVTRPDSQGSSQAKKRVGRVRQGVFARALLRVDAVMQPGHTSYVCSAFWASPPGFEFLGSGKVILHTRLLTQTRPPVPLHFCLCCVFGQKCLSALQLPHPFPIII